MNKNELVTLLLEQHPELNTSNTKFLKKAHLVQLIEEGSITLTQEELVAIFVERNDRARKNLTLNREHTKLVAENNTLKKVIARGSAAISNLTDFSRSEILTFVKTFTDEELQQEGLTTTERANKKITHILRETKKRLEFYSQAMHKADQAYQAHKQNSKRRG